MLNVPTPHNGAKPGDFAKTVLMPGDPLRARMIAERFLDGARLVNDVRGIGGFTGAWKGCPVSVMASGMGMPSMGIYSYELFEAYGVENIIRIGSAGAIQENVKIRDLLIGMGACTNSNYASQYHLPGTFAPLADFGLLKRAAGLAEEKGYSFHVGNLLSSDTFYTDDETAAAQWRKMGVLGIEMEAAALYMNAARCGKRALAICTVSDHILTGEELDAKARQESFLEMIELALDLAV
ncbi:MAG: purine-nucleoside phosphorylase [Lachnospiraceae bacterium]|nr:purine-nucleoside phosphorylase [Lachnospiraceae bacterium]